MNNKNHIAVLGSRGFIGSRLITYLQGTNANIIKPGSETCNLLNPLQVTEFIEKLPDESRVIFLASINKPIERSFRSMISNIEMVQNFVDASKLRRLGGVVFLSAVDIYGLDPSLPIHEESLPSPYDYYSISKLCGEYLIRKCDVYDYPILILRLPGTYGHGDNGKSIIGKFLDMIMQGKTISIHGDGNVLRDYIDVKNVCQAIESFCKDPFSDVVNVVSGNSLSILEIINLLEKYTGKRVGIEFTPKNTDAANDLVFDNTKFKSKFPEIKIIDAEEGIQNFAKYYKG